MVKFSITTNLKFAKDSDNNFSVRNQTLQMEYIHKNSVFKEHVCLIDNYTVFGDVIYDVEPAIDKKELKY